MLREYFLNKVIAAVKEITDKNEMGQMSTDDTFSLGSEVPKNPPFGGFAVNW